jgi:hypothetical protein
MPAQAICLKPEITLTLLSAVFMRECLPNLNEGIKGLVGKSAKEIGESADDKRLQELGYNKVSKS